MKIRVLVGHELDFATRIKQGSDKKFADVIGPEPKWAFSEGDDRCETPSSRRGLRTDDEDDDAVATGDGVGSGNTFLPLQGRISEAVAGCQGHADDRAVAVSASWKG